MLVLEEEVETIKSRMNGEEFARVEMKNLGSEMQMPVMFLFFYHFTL